MRAIFSIAFTSLVLVSLPVTAQEIRRVTPPGLALEDADEWTISHNRKFDPDNYELDGVVHSQDEVSKRIAQLRAWNATIEDKDWKLTVILIEASSSGKTKAKKDDGIPKRDLPKLNSDLNSKKDDDAPKLDLPKLKKDANSKPGDVLGEYKDVVALAWKNAKEAEGKLRKLTGKVTEAEFRAMNKMISNFNQTRDQAIAATGDKFASMPAIPEVREGDMNARITRSIELVQIPYIDVSDQFATPASKADEKSVVSGKRGTGSLGPTKAKIDFQKDGKFRVTDDNDKEIASGKWIQSGNEVTFATKSYVYMGKADGEKAQGVRINTGDRLGKTEELWSVSLSSISSLENTIWLDTGLKTTDATKDATKSEIQFKQDGVVIWTLVYAKSGNTNPIISKGSWKQSPNKVVMQFNERDYVNERDYILELTGQITGDEMQLDSKKYSYLFRKR